MSMSKRGRFKVAVGLMFLTCSIITCLQFEWEINTYVIDKIGKTIHTHILYEHLMSLIKSHVPLNNKHVTGAMV